MSKHSFKDTALAMFYSILIIVSLYFIVDGIFGFLAVVLSAAGGLG